MNDQLVSRCKRMVIMAISTFGTLDNDSLTNDKIMNMDDQEFMNELLKIMRECELSFTTWVING